MNIKLNYPVGILGKGFLGDALIKKLEDKGIKYFFTQRCLSGQGVVFDLKDENSFSNLPLRAFDVIWSIPPLEDSIEKEESALNVFKAHLDTHGYQIKRIIYISSTSVYPSKGDFNEEDVFSPDTAKGRMRIFYEQYFMNTFSDTVIIRPGGIYGPGRNVWVNPSRTHHRDPDKVIARIHVFDLAELCLKLLTDASPPKRINAVDHYPCSRREMLEWLSRDQRYVSMLESAFGLSQKYSQTLSQRRISGEKLKKYMPLQFKTYKEGYAHIIGLPR